MSEFTYPDSLRDITLTLRVPFEEIWFVQHMIEAFDGIGMVSSNTLKDNPSCIEVLTCSGQYNDLLLLLRHLGDMIGNMEILYVEGI